MICTPSSSIPRRSGGGREAVAVGPPLVLVPARADAHLDAAAGDDVAGGGHLREVGGVAVAHARAHLAQPHPLGDRAERGHQRPRLVRGLVGGRGHGVEVVVDPDRLPRARVGVLGEPLHHPPLVGGLDPDEVVPPALGNEQSEAHASDPKRRRGPGSCAEMVVRACFPRTAAKRVGRSGQGRRAGAAPRASPTRRGRRARRPP